MTDSLMLDDPTTDIINCWIKTQLITQPNHTDQCRHLATASDFDSLVTGEFVRLILQSLTAAIIVIDHSVQSNWPDV